MKKSNMLMLTVLAALLITATTNAQDYEPKSLITPEQFIEKVRGMNIPGFSGRLQFETDEEDEFQAAFSQGGEIVIITLNARHRPPTWSVSPYKLDGKDAEYVFRNGMGTLAIDLPETYSVLTIGSNKIKDKAGLERIARETGFMRIAPESAGWPTRIPADYRLKGVLLEVTEGRDYDADFSYQVRATLIMSKQVLESLMELMGKYEDEGDFLRFPDGTILNYPFSEIESIDEMYGENEKITFTYYIP
jgi:hypothetical protein